MRIRITITPMTTGVLVLPVNYQYPLSAWIYRVISQGNHAFAAFLHEHGYGTGNKSFRFFTFSMLDFTHGRYRLVEDRIEYDGDELALVISFLVPKALEHFISGLFHNQSFSLGDRRSQASFRVKGVEVFPEPIFSGRMQFRAFSPVLVSEKVDGRKNARYVNPEEELFGSMLTNNLMNKHIAMTEAGLELPDPTAIQKKTWTSANVQVLSKPRKKGITIKADTPQQTQIIGYLFDFEIMAPPQLIRIGYHAGFGEKNSLGMGCCEVITNQNS